MMIYTPLGPKSSSMSGHEGSDLRCLMFIMLRRHDATNVGRLFRRPWSVHETFHFSYFHINFTLANRHNIHIIHGNEWLQYTLSHRDSSS